MKKKEKELFFKLCSFKGICLEREDLKHATSAVLGMLFFNRMQAVAYGVMRENGLLGAVNREFRNPLKSAWEQNKEKNESYFICVEYVNKLLSDCGANFAMLKGAYLCGVYPEGYRTSNDIDLLVDPRDVTKIGECLAADGFRQGNIRNGEFLPATRREIIESKMLRGETVPYIKEVALPQMRFLEVDINFSLDYKNGESDVLGKMLSRTIYENVGKYSVRTLCKEDFFIHLCAHLYKEATTLPWVEMGRDMTLYKYCDLYMLLSEMTKKDMEDSLATARTYGMEKIYAFAVLQTLSLFDKENLSAKAKELCEKIIADEPEMLHKVISPKGNKEYEYKDFDIAKRFFCDNRLALLNERKIQNNEKT